VLVVNQVRRLKAGIVTADRGIEEHEGPIGSHWLLPPMNVDAQCGSQLWAREAQSISA
jgi:hypothetical protein